MEPPLKKQRFSGYGIADVDLQRKRTQNDQRLQSIFESIFQKYERDFDGIGDVIDLETGTIEVDNGHIYRMTHEKDTGVGLRNSSVAATSSHLSEDEISGSADDLAPPSVRESCGQPITPDLANGFWTDDGKPTSSNTNIQKPLLDSKTAILGSINDDFEDELATGGNEPATPCTILRGKPSDWQLPNQTLTYRQKTGNTSAWSIPSLPTSLTLPKARPLHRRITLPHFKKPDITGIERHAFGKKNSLWAVEPKRDRRTRLKRIKDDSQLAPPEPGFEKISQMQRWATSDHDKLCYLKTQTKLAYHQIIKYFPGQNEQSLQDYWNEVITGKCARPRIERRDLLSHEMHSAPLFASMCANEPEKQGPYVSNSDPSSSPSLDSRLLSHVEENCQDFDAYPLLERGGIDSISSDAKSYTHLPPQEISKQEFQLHDSCLDERAVMASKGDPSPCPPGNPSQDGDAIANTYFEDADSDPLAESSLSCPDPRSRIISSPNKSQSSRVVQSLKRPKNVHHSEQSVALNPQAELEAAAENVIGSSKKMKNPLFDKMNAFSKQNTHMDMDAISASQQRSTPNKGPYSEQYAPATCDRTPRKGEQTKTQIKRSVKSKAPRHMQITELRTSSTHDELPPKEISDSQSSQVTSGLSSSSANPLDEDGSFQEDTGYETKAGRLMKLDRERNNTRHISPSSLRALSRRQSASATSLSDQDTFQNQLLVLDQTRSLQQTSLLPKAKMARTTSQISLSQLYDGSDDDLSICLTQITPNPTRKTSTQKSATTPMLPSGIGRKSHSTGNAAKAPSRCSKVATLPKITRTLSQGMADCSDDELA